ncbi:MAG: LysE family transporter [Anaerolineales bacterium]
MLITAVTGALVALSFSAPPGPVTMETIRRGLNGGFRPALRVQLGSIIGDLAWCMAALLGLAPLTQIAWVRGLLAVAGVGVLLVLGALGLRDTFKKASSPKAEGEASRRGAFRSGLAISMANPMAVGYWLSVGGALVAAGVAGATPAQTASFVGGFVAGTFLWAFLMAFAVRWGKRLLTPALFRAVSFVCSAALIVFGLMLASRILS